MRPGECKDLRAGEQGTGPAFQGPVFKLRYLAWQGTKGQVSNLFGFVRVPHSI